MRSLRSGTLLAALLFVLVTMAGAEAGHYNSEIGDTGAEAGSYSSKASESGAVMDQWCPSLGH